MVVEMKGVAHIGVAAFLLMSCGVQASDKTQCDASADMSAPIAEFDAKQVSPLDALLRFGAEHHLCFGIEYVDQDLLTRPADFQLRNTTVKAAVLRILDSSPALTIEQHFGVIEIRRRMADPPETSVFDHVIPKWEAPRGFVQLVSWLLYVQLSTDLNPDAKGFAVHARAGDPRDEVGPFTESNLPVRYLLDKIVAQSKGGAWIAQVSWKQIGDLALVKSRRIWTIVEYGGADADYTALLRTVAGELGAVSEAANPR